MVITVSGKIQEGYRSNKDFHRHARIFITVTMPLVFAVKMVNKVGDAKKHKLKSKKEQKQIYWRPKLPLCLCGPVFGAVLTSN